MLKVKYYFEWLVYFLIFSLVAIIQVAFISSLPGVYAAVNLPLIALLFSLLFFNRETTLVLALIMGFWLDILSFDFFGLNIILFLTIIILADFSLRNWLTNRSLYSFLILSFLSVFLYNVLFYLILVICQSNSGEAGFFLFRLYFWKQVFWQMLWSAGFTLLFFNLANSLSKHFKPFFLEKK